MLNAKISGIASYLPDDVLDNEMLSKMVDTNDEWITTRVGVKERRILNKPVGSSYMGIQAVNKLLEETGVDRNDIDLLICPTSNPDYRFPSTASVIAHNVGIEKKCYAYDIQAACAGFLVGMYEATAYVRAGIYKKVIVVSAEKMSSMVDYNDRATCPLFGDAAAAVLIEPTEEPVGIMDGIFHVDGSGLEHLVYKAGGSALRTSHETVDPTRPTCASSRPSASDWASTSPRCWSTSSIAATPVPPASPCASTRTSTACTRATSWFSPPSVRDSPGVPSTSSGRCKASGHIT